MDDTYNCCRFSDYWLVRHHRFRLLQVSKAITDNQLWQGFRVPTLIRFVNEESAYLSLTSGGPRMYVNLEDYVSKQSGTDNVPFLVSYEGACL